MSRGRSTIVRRLVLLTIAAGLVTGIVGLAVVGAVERRQLRDDALVDNHAVADRIATVIDGRLGALRSQLELLASREPIVAFGDAGTELGVGLRVSDDLDRLVLYDRPGRPLAAVSSSRLLSPGDLPARPDLAGALEGAGAQVIVSRGDGALPAVEVAVPVEDPPGSVVGALVGSAPVAVVVQGTEKADVETGASAFVVDREGIVIAHRELERVLAGESYPMADVFGDARRMAVVETGDGAVLTAAAALTVMSGWVVVEQPEADVAPRLGSTFGDVTAVFLAVIAAIVVAVVLAGHRLLRPLRPLAEAVERLGRGELGVRVERDGAGEVGILADGFNRMAAALQSRQLELEAAERLARRSEERLRLMVEGVEDYAIVLLDLDGRVRSWNTGARRLLGPDSEEAVGRPLASFLDPHDPPDDPLAQAAAGGRGDVEGWCRRDDGRRFWARIVATSLRDEEGAPYGYAVVLHDLTARHRAHEATEVALQREREAAEELRRTNRLKDEFLAVAAHEIRTPLSAILGASSVLVNDWDELDDDERRRFRDMIDTHAQDMRAVAERLLDLTRLQAGRVRLVAEEVRLDQEMPRLVSLVQTQLDGHEVVLDIASATVHLDPQALRHVVTNLVSNAAKFSPAGSRITVGARVDGPFVTVEVTDEGVGIPSADQEHIFEMFHQSSDGPSARRGAGIGLAIVRRYAELSGGGVEVESAPGEGATFRVTLRAGHVT